MTGPAICLEKRTGVAEQIKKLQPKAVDTHCHGHSLSLSMNDTTNSSRILSDIMGTMAEITTLVKYSPKRQNMLGVIKHYFEFENSDDIEAERSIGLTKLCVTRWTVRATAFKRVMDNYEALYKLWDDCLEGNLNRETSSRIIGCQSQTTQFRFFLPLILAIPYSL